MTARPATPIFSALWLALACLAAGCASTDDAVPEGSLAAQAQTTGQFPNLNIVPKAEVEQLTEAEKNAKTAELKALAARQQARSSGASGTSSPAELRRLAGAHAGEALEEIETE